MIETLSFISSYDYVKEIESFFLILTNYTLVTLEIYNQNWKQQRKSLELINSNAAFWKRY